MAENSIDLARRPNMDKYPHFIHGIWGVDRVRDSDTKNLVNQ